MNENERTYTAAEAAEWEQDLRDFYEGMAEHALNFDRDGNEYTDEQKREIAKWN